MLLRKQMRTPILIPLSTIMLLAHQHGGRYDVNGTGAWPWSLPYRVRRDGTVNCSTLSMSVLVEAHRRTFGVDPKGLSLRVHRLWMVSSKTDDDFDEGARISGPVHAAALLGLDGASVVTLRQGWRGKPLVSSGHTWMQIETPEGPKIIDATSDDDFNGVRICAPRPSTFKFQVERACSLAVDVVA